MPEPCRSGRKRYGARTTPQVAKRFGSRLTASQEPIVVGSSAWFAWLEQAQLFTFRSAAWTFTARHERRAGGGVYWRAYRTIGGQQRLRPTWNADPPTSRQSGCDCGRAAGRRSARATAARPALAGGHDASAGPILTASSHQALRAAPTRWAHCTPSAPGSASPQVCVARLTLIAAPVGSARRPCLLN